MNQSLFNSHQHDSNLHTPCTNTKIIFILTIQILLDFTVPSVGTGIWSIPLRRSISLKQKNSGAKNYQPQSNHLKLLVINSRHPMHLHLMTFADSSHTTTTYNFFSSNYLLIILTVTFNFLRWCLEILYAFRH